MAADEARADRIRQLKAEHPELTWRAIADHVGVSERAAVEWQKSGGIEYENAKKLAQLFPESSADYIWRGDTPDLMGAVSGDTDEITALRNEIAELRAELNEFRQAISSEPDSDMLSIVSAYRDALEEHLARPSAPSRKRTATG